MNDIPTLPVKSRSMIAPAPQKSLLRELVRWLGSLQLAMILLIVLAGACAFATITESSFDSRVAQHYIYKAPWFIAWLLVLCLNLFCVTLTRWPWQRKHIGFVITHYGIITLLAGAMTGRLAGFEGFLVLEKGQPPQNRIVLQESVLQMQSPVTGNLYEIALPVEASPPSPTRPLLLDVPESNLRLRLDGYSENLVVVENVVPASETVAGAAVQLTLHSQMMGQDVPILLRADSADQRSRDFFGLAKVEWVDAFPQETANAAPKNSPRESQLLFALNPDRPIIESSFPERLGYQVQLQRKPADETFLVAIRTPQGETIGWPLDQVLRHTVTLPGGTHQLSGVNYWPHFVIKKGQPISLSGQPINPALLVQITETPAREGDQKSTMQPRLQLMANTHQGVDYQLSRGPAVYARGTLIPAEPLTLGWADWQATLMVYAPHAEIRTHIEDHPVKKNSPPPLDAIPGIHAAVLLPDGQVSESRWILSGRAQVFAVADQTVQAGFGLKTHRLPFFVTLEDFAVPRDEGTETPANYISSLRFDDPVTQKMRREVAQMNQPASFPGGFWRSAIGQNYKFSQASWNPQNLNETTLQILYDPGWPLKWIGSLMICAGIFLLFYWRTPSSRNFMAPKKASLPNLPSTPSPASS